jgi:hypothetical protein
MALGPDNFNASVAFTTLFDFFGADSGGLLQDDSEPYLWVVMFKIDGTSLVQDGNYLAGAASFFLSPGSHGNIADEVSDGANVRIPPQVGRWDTTLQPIPIGVAGYEFTSIPPLIGCAAVLLEENDTPDSAMEAGHQEVNTLVQTTLNDVLTNTGLAGLAADTAAEIATQAAKGKTVAPADAMQTVLQRRLKPVQDLFTATVPGAVESSIINNLDLGGFIGSGISRDQIMGANFQLFGQSDLLRTDEHDPIPILFAMDNPDNWAYNLHGDAWAHIRYLPIPQETTPSGDLVQISCITKSYSDTRGEWISSVGGVENGTPWRLPRSWAVDFIQKGQKSFFVQGPSGSHADVVVGDDARVGHPYLTTRPDGKPDDNLLSLPACPAFDVEYY